MTELFEEARRFRSALTETSLTMVEAVELFETIPSTNTWLLEQNPPAQGCCRVALAEHQSAGRGRRGKTWLSVPGKSLCLSAAFTLRKGSAQLAGLTLALATRVIPVLCRFGVAGVSIKWPNDLVLNDGKLGGFLTELVSRGSSATVVVGLGINLGGGETLQTQVRPGWAQRAASLSEVLTKPVDRVLLAAAIVDTWVNAVAEFDERGFGPFRDEWRDHDYLRHKIIKFADGPAQRSGQVIGIDDDGALLVECEGRCMRVIAGEISIQHEGHTT